MGGIKKKGGRGLKRKWGYKKVGEHFSQFVLKSEYSDFSFVRKNKQTDRQTDRQTDKQTNRQTFEDELCSENKPLGTASPCLAATILIECVGLVGK